MNMKNTLNKTFSMQQQFDSKYQSQRCEFCLYRGAIFQQLHQLKQAIIIKNKRIKDLEEFITKISKMAFINNLNNPSQIIFQKQIISESGHSNNFVNDSRTMQMIQESNKKNQQTHLAQLRFQDSDQISFRLSKKTTQLRQSKIQDNLTIKSKFDKLNELNEIKKQIQDKLKSTQKNKLNVTYKNERQRQSLKNNYDTIKTLSEPHEEGLIGYIQHMQNGMGQVDIQNDKQTWFDKLKGNLDIERLVFAQSMSNGNKIEPQSPGDEDRISIDIIKQFIKAKIK